MKSMLLFAIVTVIAGILSRLSVCASTDALKLRRILVNTNDSAKPSIHAI